jgi:formamidopyrimidine-DNA glycosylase
LDSRLRGNRHQNDKYWSNEMPELPEVETVKNQISPHIIGRTITEITLPWEGMVKEPSVKDFLEGTRGQKITGTDRHGKYLILTLSSGDCLIIHLKMTGSLILGTSEPPKYTRAIIHLDRGLNVFFRDPRKFGVLKLVKDTTAIDRGLGPEPFDRSFTKEIFAERLHKRKAPIKALLLDQKFMAGVGNMYADEALFLARIHPARPSDSLTPIETNNLYKAIRKVLKEGIKYGGASVVTYFHPDGSTGTAHQHFNVAHNQHKTCPVCGGQIKRIVVRGRGTYYCPKCQREK